MTLMGSCSKGSLLGGSSSQGARDALCAFDDLTSSSDTGDLGFVQFWEAHSKATKIVPYDEAARLWWYFDTDHNGRVSKSEWRTAFANAHKSPREEPPGYDTLQIAQLLSRFVDYLHANFYSYQCRLEGARGGASDAAFQCAWATWTRGAATLPFGELWAALEEAFPDDLPDYPTAQGAYWYLDANHDGRLERLELFYGFEAASKQCFAMESAPRSFDFAKVHDAFRAWARDFASRAETDTWMAVTNGKGGALDFGTFRLSLRDEQHGGARWLNGTAEDEAQSFFYAADLDRDCVVSKAEWTAALKDLQRSANRFKGGASSPFLFALGKLFSLVLYAGCAWVCLNCGSKGCDLCCKRIAEAAETPRTEYSYDRGPLSPEDPAEPDSPQYRKRSVRQVSEEELQRRESQIALEAEHGEWPAQWHDLGSNMKKRLEQAKQVRVEERL